jgi:hypothetical protein
METPDLYKLVETLRKNNKTDQYIIEVLVSIIKQYMTAGGSLSDIINYQFYMANKESR